MGGGTAALGMPDTFILHRDQFQCVLKSRGIFSTKMDQAHGYVENDNHEKKLTVFLGKRLKITKETK